LPPIGKGTRWRDCLDQIRERGGSIEVAIARQYRHDDEGRHLLWRVRVLEVNSSDIVVEAPVTLGRALPVRCGTEMVGIIAVGQNRWMFSTTNLGTAEIGGAARRTPLAMRLAMPEAVERCQRRHHYRVETAALSLPEVDMWPLLDPKSVLVAERANEIQFEEDERLVASGDLRERLDLEDVMPEVGPRFCAVLVNLGGGGVGLRVRPEDNQAMVRHKLFWMRIGLRPELRVPICASAKLVHTHIEATHHLYAGLAFDFSFNPAHQRFVVEQICRFLDVQQREQSERVQRRSA
jgi:hypothetical protein